MAVRGWSVKLQHQGRRRTFSLTARTRVAAAAEAQRLYRTLLSEGWDTAMRQCGGRTRPPWPKTDVRYWEERLFLRQQPVPGALGQEFSTRIEHEGNGYFFPLGVSDPDAAAARALGIYRTVVKRGWGAVRQLFPREVTLAIHWTHNPLLWTYTTLQTLPGAQLDPAPKPTHEDGPPCRILLVEADAGLRQAMALCIDQHPRCGCVTRTEVEITHGENSTRGAALCLVNDSLAGRMGLPESAQTGVRASDIPALTYSVHADSDAVFLAVPGGVSGYGFRRLPPCRILEPISGILAAGAVSTEALVRAAHAYFQQVLRSPSAPEELRVHGQLTQREQEVLNLLSKGFLDKEIARALGISTWTVHEHVKRVFDKLRVHSRTEAVLTYLQK